MQKKLSWTNCNIYSSLIDLSSWSSFWSTCNHGKRVLRTDQETTARMPEPVCSCLGRLMRASTSLSILWLTKLLLQESIEFVLTERFCQDPVEEYFGNQRKLGRRSDNPDIRQFGYNANTIRIQRSVSCQSGNTRGRKDKRREWEQVTDAKLPCRKKTKL